MNTTEAIAVYTLIGWITGAGRPRGGHYTGQDAGQAAAELAGRAHAVLMAGHPAEAVLSWFNRHQPRVVPQPAYVTILDPPELRTVLHDDCSDCAVGRCEEPDCAQRRVAALTDDQLRVAAARVLGRDCPLDEGLDLTRDLILTEAEIQVQPRRDAEAPRP